MTSAQPFSQRLVAVGPLLAAQQVGHDHHHDEHQQCHSNRNGNAVVSLVSRTFISCQKRKPTHQIKIQYSHLQQLITDVTLKGDKNVLKFYFIWKLMTVSA